MSLPPLPYTSMANAIRVLSMEAVEKAQSGHPGLPMGMAEVGTVLFSTILKHHPPHPEWYDRDRFVLSAGHGSLLLYCLLYLSGYASMGIEDIKKFRSLHSVTPGHPEKFVTQGVEATTGPLGQGLGNAVGMALSEHLLGRLFGEDIVNHHTYALVGDGCLMEGISQEVISFAGHYKLKKLIVLFDNNAISIDGPTSLTCSTDQRKRFLSEGWSVWEASAHDVGEITESLEAAKRSECPSLVIFHSVIGKGSVNKSGTSAVHGSALGAEEVEVSKKALGWGEVPAFEVPEEVLKCWRRAKERHTQSYEGWCERLASHPDRERFLSLMKGERISEELGKGEVFKSLKEQFIKESKSLSTRKASFCVLESLCESTPCLLGGSADLTGSNLTKTKHHKLLSEWEEGYSFYIHYGVREHGMGAIMNGIALHGGFIPYGGTFLAFSDYMRPSIRLAALSALRVVYVFSHDSIGLGEDGPTHQPVEHLESLRLIPNLLVFRPCDGVETADCWQLALQRFEGPSVLALSRQDLGFLRKGSVVLGEGENLCVRGAYKLWGSSESGEVKLLASGSEVGLALEVAYALEAEKISSQVISVPCKELFDKQPKGYRDSLLGGEGLCVVIEAGREGTWRKYLGEKGIFMGLSTFGLSAPYEALYNTFGLKTELLTRRIKKALGEGSKGC